MAKLQNAKYEQFCHEYVASTNGKQSAIKAGYSAKTAEVKASQLLRIVKVQLRLKELTEMHNKPTIATADEVMELLTDIMRGKLQGTRVPDVKDMIKSAELMGKRHALFTDKVEHAGEMNITFTDDYGE
jgi:phage terminase small subunit